VIPDDITARIRRYFFAEHWKIGTISAELGVHHDTVRRAIASDTFNRSATRPVPPSLLDPYKALLEDTLAQHPRLRSTRLFEMIRARGYPGSAVQVRRHVARIRPRARTEAYLRLRTLPGEQAQVDWGHFGKIRIGHADRALSCFVMVLSWSRAMYARFFLDQTTESFLRGHVLGFASLGGVPRGVLYDNLKSVVVERQGDHIRYGASVLELCGHYHFAPHPCAPARGNEKGKVERSIQYLRHAFFAARRFGSVEDLNRQLAEWIDAVAHRRLVPGDPERRIVSAALDEERPRLLPLPEHAFECDTVRPVTSGKTPYVRFDLNDYSIPHHLVGKPLTLIASETAVRITGAVDGTVFAEHARSYDRGQTIEDPAHLAALAVEKRRAHELRGRDRLRASCKQADVFLDALALRSEPLGAHTRRLLLLLDAHGARAVDEAIKDALSRGAVSADSVAHLLEQKARTRKRPPHIPISPSGDPRVKDLRVTPHDLAAYDALSKTDTDKEPQ
jgi:transposase